MEARELQEGFFVGAWLIEPRELRASRAGKTLAVPLEHMQVLLCLVESQGEFVHRHTLRNRIHADEPGGDQKLRQIIAAWHAVFGDTAHRPRYIDAAGQDGYSFIAHFEPAHRMPIPERLLEARRRSTGATGGKRTLVGIASHLLAELRRRSVFRVAASYLIGMWILLQVAEVTLAPLHLPAWWITALTILGVVGLPIVFVLAWTYEITSDGLARDSADVAAATLLPNFRHAVAPAVIAGVVLMAAVTAYAWWESIR